MLSVPRFWYQPSFLLSPTALSLQGLGESWRWWRQVTSGSLLLKWQYGWSVTGCIFYAHDSQKHHKRELAGCLVSHVEVCLGVCCSQWACFSPGALSASACKSCWMPSLVLWFFTQPDPFPHQKGSTPRTHSGNGVC